jgi:hypothetical protein
MSNFFFLLFIFDISCLLFNSQLFVPLFIHCYFQITNTFIDNRKPTLDKKSLDEIPPDPVNFLREDQGEDQTVQERPQPPNQRRNQPRQRGPPNHNRNSTNQQPSGDRPQQHQSPRDSNQQQQRNNNPRNKQNNPRRDNTNTQGGGDSTTAPPPRRPHPQALRNERRTVNNATPNNADSASTNEASPTAAANPPPPSGGPKRSPHKQQRVRKDQGDQRNDITIQLTDEVRSVKSKIFSSFLHLFIDK